MRRSHTPESCPVSSGGGVNPVPDWLGRAKGVGVEIISAAVCAPAHVRFFTVKTDDYPKLHELFRPYMGFAKSDITPVSTKAPFDGKQPTRNQIYGA